MQKTNPPSSSKVDPSFPSLFIARVFPNITHSRITTVLNEIGLGIIDHIDMIKLTDKRNNDYYRVFIHFKTWYKTDLAIKARDRVLSGKEIKIIYSDPWFWKIAADRSCLQQVFPKSDLQIWEERRDRSFSQLDLILESNDISQKEYDLLLVELTCEFQVKEDSYLRNFATSKSTGRDLYNLKSKPSPFHAYETSQREIAAANRAAGIVKKMLPIPIIIPANTVLPISELCLNIAPRHLDRHFKLPSHVSETATMIKSIIVDFISSSSDFGIITHPNSSWIVVRIKQDNSPSILFKIDLFRIEDIDGYGSFLIEGCRHDISRSRFSLMFQELETYLYKCVLPDFDYKKEQVQLQSLLFEE